MTPLTEMNGDDTTLLALVAQWREADDEHKRVVHEHSVEEEAGRDDPDGYRRTEDAIDVLTALERRIMQDFPAHTLAGLVAKLGIAFDATGAMPSHREKWSTEDWTVWSCWQDAKRLAGGAA